MRTVLQRVNRAAVRVDGEVVASVGEGLLALVGVTHGDGAAEAATTARRVAELRILDGERSVAGAGAEVLVVSQFTLHADVRKGRRPSWSAASPGSVAQPVVDAVADELRRRGITVATGRFGATMSIDLEAYGPMTVVLDVPPGRPLT